jgi:hypothetical protein
MRAISQPFSDDVVLNRPGVQVAKQILICSYMTAAPTDYRV